MILFFKDKIWKTKKYRCDDRLVHMTLRCSVRGKSLEFAIGVS